MDVADEPFPGSWAVNTGLLTRWELHQDYRRIHRDVYLRRGVELDERRRALSAALWAKGRGVLTGCSAAVLLGVACPGDSPTELAHPTVTRAPQSLRLRRDRFCPQETTSTGGVAVTTPARTAYDIGRRLAFADAVETIDTLCRTTGTTLDEIAAIAEKHPGARGIASLRTALEHADPAAASRQETRIRLLITGTGLPQPDSRIELSTPAGASADVALGWPNWKVAVAPASDLDQAAVLDELGWKTVWVTPELLTSQPHLLPARVRAALIAHGAPVGSG